MKLAYYNEIDPFAAEWLRNLVAAGHIPPGDVDERSIEDVAPGDLAGYDQCHFFAGIGGWPLALRMAGWPDDLPVWTGSCPCQPFSTAGQRKGFNDERHLWPAFYRLITERTPSVCFGEQVAGTAGLAWLASVRTDLESVGYAVGAADLCAAGIGADHRRQRLYWLADAGEERRDRCGTLWPGKHEAGWSREAGWMGDAIEAGLEGHTRHVDDGPQRGRNDEEEKRPASTPGFWRDHDIIPFGDGRLRRIEPGLAPMAHGIPRVVASMCAEQKRLLRGAKRYRRGTIEGFGNAIVPQIAAEFVMAFVDVKKGERHG